MNSKIKFQNDFTICIEVFEIAKVLYLQKDYEECLSFINESIEMMDLTNSYLFADFLSLTGKILWKECHYEQAVVLWKKALAFNTENRTAQLCLKLLDDKNISYNDNHPDFSQTEQNSHTDCTDCSNDDFSIKVISEYL